jgi:hypothetical protein
MHCRQCGTVGWLMMLVPETVDDNQSDNPQCIQEYRFLSVLQNTK